VKADVKNVLELLYGPNSNSDRKCCKDFVVYIPNFLQLPNFLQILSWSLAHDQTGFHAVKTNGFTVFLGVSVQNSRQLLPPGGGRKKTPKSGGIGLLGFGETVAILTFISPNHIFTHPVGG